MEAVLRLSGSFPQRHLETASQETPSSTPPGRPALPPSCTKSSAGVSRKPFIVPSSFFFGGGGAEFQISQGFVEQLHRGSPPEVQPQATEVPQSGSQGPATPHQRGNAGSNPGEECHFPGLSGGGADFTSTCTAAVAFLAACLFNQSLRDIMDLFDFSFVIKALRVVEQQV